MGIRQAIKRTPAWAKISIGIFLLLMLGGTIGLNAYLNKLVNKRLREMVLESSDGLYRLEYSGVSMNAFSGNITIHNAQLIPDTAVFTRLRQSRHAPRFLIAGKTESVSLRNVRWLAFVNSKKLNIGKLIIQNPQFNLTQYRQHNGNDSAHKPAGIFNFVSKHVKDLKLGLFSIDDAVIHYQVADTLARMRTINTIEHLRLGFRKVHFAGDTEQDRRLAADDYYIELKEYRHRTGDSMYWLGMTGLKYNSKQGIASMASFYSEPRYNEEEFSRKTGFQATRYALELKNISAEGFDVTALVQDRIVRMRKMNVDSGSAQFYMNRAYPLPKEDKKNVVLSQKILNLDFPLSIDSLNLKNFTLSYREYQPNSGQTAVLSFQGISGRAGNVTNLPAVIARNPQMKASLSARFLGAEVKASLSFALDKPDGSFGATLDINQVAAEKLNPILTPMALIEARDGILQKLECTISGTENRAMADVKLLYEDLKINLLEKSGGTLEKKGFKSMFANILVWDDNPKDGALRTSRQSTSRKHGKSFFNLAWSAVAAGILDIILKEKGIRL
ncbi:MAG TPA: hypothetical protein VD993_17245 [Chitinophagaceae bacterium]|nr:hypothetical protein [Chitinophagaceae bacterium]